ncbi:MAG: hypothetical protein JWQ89_4571 [Devosia sp.]|uniref:hypothetical protein n=1 Tax=Devosia sp. TaxID=1871048 RepID=UPI002627DBFE|nr:hypothetical protein [Devosia sp.]MDB5542844.1 hypothetical protein [Devosia sp.]
MSSVKLSAADRQRWQGRHAAAVRALKQYPTILVDTDLVIIVTDYIAVLESANDFLRDTATRPTAEATERLGGQVQLLEGRLADLKDLRDTTEMAVDSIRASFQQLSEAIS